MTKYLNQIPEAEWTLWERAYNAKRPSHFYKIREEWGATDRDFMAFWNGKLQDALEEYGHPSARPVRDISWWMDPIVRDGVDTKHSTARQWTDYAIATLEAFEALSWADMEALREVGVGYHEKYANAVATRWDAMSQAERDAARGMTEDQRRDRENFENMTPEERAEMEFGHKCQEIAFWAMEQPNTEHEDRWFRALAALGQDAIDAAAEVLGGAALIRLRAATPMSAAEAEENCSRFMRSRWRWPALKIHGREMADPVKADAYKAEQDAYAEQVRQFQMLRDAGDPDAQQGFDEWKRPNRAMFPWNGTYVMDARSECYIAYDGVARRRAELTAENVRYRLDCDRPDGIRQISWLALNYEGCLCWLPHYDEAKAEKTRMVAASEVPQLIAAGWRVLTEAEYADNQRTRNARDDRFAAFRLYVQHAPDDTPLGICPKQGDSGEWKHNADLFARLHAVEETIEVAAPSDMAAAIAAGDWAEVARLAAERAA